MDLSFQQSTNLYGSQSIMYPGTRATSHDSVDKDEFSLAYVSKFHPLRIVALTILPRVEYPSANAYALLLFAASSFSFSRGICIQKPVRICLYQ